MKASSRKNRTIWAVWFYRRLYFSFIRLRSGRILIVNIIWFFQATGNVPFGSRPCKNAIFKKLVVNRISIFNQWSAIVVHHVSTRFNSCSTWGAVPSTPKFSEFLHGLGHRPTLDSLAAECRLFLGADIRSARRSAGLTVEIGQKRSSKAAISGKEKPSCDSIDRYCVTDHDRASLGGSSAPLSSTHPYTYRVLRGAAPPPAGVAGHPARDSAIVNPAPLPSVPGLRDRGTDREPPAGPP